nr:formate dehydrogenase subunit alpha [Candidatus Sigynarchaeum springense]
MKRVKTTCVYCGTGCQLYLFVNDEGKVVDTRPVMPPEFSPGGGKLCIKGWNVHEFIQHPDRLTDPMIRKDGKLEKVSWEEAIKYVADNFKKIMAENPGNNRVLGCFSSAKCTNEENYAMQKFCRAVLKSNNVDHCARLCHASTVAGLASTFGSGAMTNSIDEIADAEVILITGSNTNEQHPLIGRRILEALHKGGKLIVVDPRTIPLSELAEEHGGIVMHQRPGTDVAWMNAVMNVIINENLYNKEFVENNCENFDEFKAEVMKMTPEIAEGITGIPKQKLIDAAHMIAKAKSVSLIYSMGITQHTTGVDNVRSTANLQMLCGNIGKRATGVNPLRGQQNVQGSCDMGALPNGYSGYQPVTEPANREKMAKEWGIPVAEMDDKVGLTVVEMVNAAHDGKLKGLYIMGENPMMSDPDLHHVEAALKNVFLVVQDIFPTPTTALANVVLPAACFAEKDGTFTSTERRVQMVRKAVEPVGKSKPDWEIIGLIAKEMGYNGLSYKQVREIMDEVNRVTPSYAGITWDRLLTKEDGLQWPCKDPSHPGTKFLHADGKFTRGKGHFFAVPFKEPAELPDKEYPFILTTGRMLWQYHTGTMSRRSPTLNSRAPEAYVEMSITDATELGLVDGQKVKVKSRRGEITLKVKVTHRVNKGVIFIPFHFEEAAVNKLTIAALDPIAKIPEYKVCAAQVIKI